MTARSRNDAPIWLLGALLMGATVALVLTGPILSAEAVTAGLLLPWWAIAAGFLLTESFTIDVHLRRETHSISISELVLVLGLFFADPTDLLIGSVVGQTVALWGVRRSSSIKVFYNLAQNALSVTVGLLVFISLAPADPFTPWGWAAALAAIASMELVGATAVSTAIALAEHERPSRRLVTELFGLATLATLCLALLGIASAQLLREDWRASVLLIVPAFVLAAGYRDYVRQRQRAERVEFLYRSMLDLQASGDAQRAISTLLLRTREMFRCELAEIVLLGDPGHGPGVRATLSHGYTDPHLSTATDEAIRSAGILEREGTLLAARGGAETARHHVLGHRVSDAMVVPLEGETRFVGLMMVADRSNSGATFEQSDLRLLRTLGHHAALALENTRLSRSMEQIGAEKAELEHRASHDPLTGLANRRGFLDRAEAALGDPDAAPGLVGVAFIDVDDLKRLNDSLGHAAGDAALVAVAERLRSCSGPRDTPARLAGDEFALLMPEIENPAEAELAAARLVDAFDTPLVLDGRAWHLTVSIGLALRARGREGEVADLLRAADEAMYAAKSAGKARAVVR